jgi:hypothetical protein
MLWYLLFAFVLGYALAKRPPLGTAKIDHPASPPSDDNKVHDPVSGVKKRTTADSQFFSLAHIVATKGDDHDGVSSPPSPATTVRGRTTGKWELAGESLINWDDDSFDIVPTSDEREHLSNVGGQPFSKRRDDVDP